MVEQGRLLEVLNSPVRREILWMIWDQEMSASAIAGAFPLSAPTISQHLSVLLSTNVVTLRRDKNFRYYRANQSVAGVLHGLLPEESTRWIPADNIPESEEASATVVPLVIASVEVAISKEDAFKAFTDAEAYSQWLGVPVTMIDGHFSATMEWGTELRGTYDVVVPSELIALRWDISDASVPIPGRAQIGYMRFTELERGSRIEVHQMVSNQQQAEFMSAAWSLALGRFKTGITNAAGSSEAHARLPRAARPKRMNPT